MGQGENRRRAEGGGERAVPARRRNSRQINQEKYQLEKEVKKQAEEEPNSVTGKTQTTIDVRSTIRAYENKQSQKPSRTSKKRKEKYGKYK